MTRLHPELVILCLTILQAMELILTGEARTAAEMERLGVVNKVYSAEEDVLEGSIKVAELLAAFSAPAIGLAKQAVQAGKHRYPNLRRIRADCSGS